MNSFTPKERLHPWRGQLPRILAFIALCALLFALAQSKLGGADLTQADFNTFVTAVQNGDADGVRKSLAVFPELAQLKTKAGITILHTASVKGPRALVEALIAAGAKANGRDNKGITPLHMAALHGQPAIIEALLAGGAELDVADNTGFTALHTAVSANKKEVVALLINRGANAAAKSADGKTPLDLAVAAKATEITAILRAKEATASAGGS